MFCADEKRPAVWLDFGENRRAAQLSQKNAWLNAGRERAPR
jgi:hypothetical protein